MLNENQISAIQHVPEIYLGLTRNYLVFYNLMFHSTKRKTVVSSLIRAIYPFILPGMRKILKSTQPDLVLVVNPILCYFLTKARRDLGLQFRIVVVVTDIATVHRLWVNPETDLCIVTSEEARCQAIQIDIPPEKIIVTDFPDSPQIHQLYGNTAGYTQEAGTGQRPVHNSNHRRRGGIRPSRKIRQTSQPGVPISPTTDRGRQEPGSIS